MGDDDDYDVVYDDSDEPCPYCDGTGEFDWLSGESCPTCNGEGVLP